MLARKPQKLDYNLNPIRPLLLKKELLLKDKMGCASSQAASASKGIPTQLTDVDGNNGSVRTSSSAVDSIKYPPPEAFEIPMDEDVVGVDGEQDDSIIKKHPPKRLQRLIDVPVQPTTIEDLEEKLAKAEIRRKNYLQQKIEGIASLTKNRDLDPEGEEEEKEEEHNNLKSSQHESKEQDNGTEEGKFNGNEQDYQLTPVVVNKGPHHGEQD